MPSLFVWMIIVLIQGGGITSEVFTDEQECQERFEELKKAPTSLGVTSCTKVQIDLEKPKA